MFGANLHELPLICEELTKENFGTGQANGKSLRTVKSCVSSKLRRYGVDESGSFAVESDDK